MKRSALFRLPAFVAGAGVLGLLLGGTGCFVPKTRVPATPVTSVQPARKTSPTPEAPPPESDIARLRRETGSLLTELNSLDVRLKDLLEEIRASYNQRTVTAVNVELAHFIKEQVVHLAAEKAAEHVVEEAAQKSFSRFSATAHGGNLGSLVSDFALVAVKVWRKTEELAAKVHEGIILHEAMEILMEEVLPALPEIEVLVVGNQNEQEEARALRDQTLEALARLKTQYDAVRRRSRDLLPGELL